MSHRSYKYTGLPFLLILALFPGCIKEDMSNCPVHNVTLNFCCLDSASNDIFQSVIRKVDLCIFHEDGRFHSSVNLSAENLTEFQGVRITLEPGTYHVVGWGNVFSDVKIGTYEEHVKENSHIRFLEGRNGDPLYHSCQILNKVSGVKSLTLKIPGNSSVTGVMNYVPVHKEIEVYIDGFADRNPDKDLNPVVKITNLIQGYNFDMEPLNEPLIYLQQQAKTVITSKGEMLFSGLYTPDIQLDHPVRIHVYEDISGEELCIIDLHKYMEEYKLEVNLGAVDERKIRIYIRFINGDVIISMPEWKDFPVDPDI